MIEKVVQIFKYDPFRLVSLMNSIIATEKNILWPTTNFVSTEEQRNPKVRKIKQQRCKVGLPKRKKSFVFHIFSRNDDYNRAYLSHLILYIIRSSWFSLLCFVELLSKWWEKWWQTVDNRIVDNLSTKSYRLTSLVLI